MRHRAEWLRRRRNRPPLALVVFDCDGVLIDSEAVCNRIVAEDLTALGWPMTPAEAEHRFIGQSFHDMLPIIEARLGRTLDPDWLNQLVTRVVAAMAEEAEPVDGALPALHAAAALGLPWRVASNSSQAEMAAKFGRLGLLDVVAGRLHSGDDMIRAGGRPKPAPDVYLDAAAAAAIPPGAALAIEDSVTGVRAAIAAGMDCLALCPPERDEAMRAAGAIPFRSMHDLPDLLRLALMDTTC